MKKEIGGYFNLELPINKNFLHDDGMCVDSGRNALALILASISDIKHLWVPYFTILKYEKGSMVKHI